MIEAITFKNFKSFADATLKLGNLTLLIGTNASGKSNIRDGFRFVHGISRGYTLAEIIGEKWIEGGVQQWTGIRGGLREACFRNGGASDNQFTIGLTTRLAGDEQATAEYSITVNVGDKGKPAYVTRESLVIQGRGKFAFNTQPEGKPANAGTHDPRRIFAQLRKNPRAGYIGPTLDFDNDRPVVTQIAKHPGARGLKVCDDCAAFLTSISAFRFLDLSPEALRQPSIPGQDILSDKGENLSSVLAGICEKPEMKEALIEWTRELTPLDVMDVRFPEVSLGGKIQLQLVEAGGKEISADSASDGTLRFLAYVAAFLGTKPADFYFFEELENGIHPNRLHLLVELITGRAKQASIQVVATTHSPAMLDYLDNTTLEDAALVYRQAGRPSQIKSLRSIPELWRVLPGRKAGGLQASGWFETVMAFCADGEPTA